MEHRILSLNPLHSFIALVLSVSQSGVSTSNERATISLMSYVC